jgi:hypothetical protein
MTEKPIKIPLATRVMPSIIAHDIKGVSPMMPGIIPVDSVKNLPATMITEKQGEGQVDIEIDPATGQRVFKADVGNMTAERALEVVEQIKKTLNG